MFKQALLVAGVLSLATAASALEVTHPFYGPAKGTVASTTTYDFETMKVKDKVNDERNHSYNHYIEEALSFGLTDSVSLDAKVANTFVKEKTLGETADRDDKNIAFELGSTWNVLTGPTKVQVSGAYGQNELNDTIGAYKYVKGGLKAGHTMGIYTPYVAGTVELPVAQSNAGDDKAKYEGKAGVYAYCPRMKTSVDTGVRVNHDEEVEYTGYSYDLEIAYHVTKNVAISAFGSYLIDGNVKGGTDVYGNKVGLKLRAAF